MFLLFDIGGTNTRVALSSDLQTLGKSVVFPTPQNFDEGINAIVKAANDLTLRPSDIPTSDLPITGFAGCAPGPMDKARTMLVNAPNLPFWNGKPLVESLKQKLGCTVGVIENDAAVVGLGETHFGAAKGKKIVMYITVSTGVGGARIVDGKIDLSASGFEPGHQIVVPWEILDSIGMPSRPSASESRDPGSKDYIDINKSNVLDPDSQPQMHSALAGMAQSTGYLEDLIGGHSLQKRFGKLPTEIKDEKVWEQCALVLAYGLHNSIVHWSPEIVVLGGSLITKPNTIPFNRVQFHLNRIMKIFPAPPLVKSELGDLAGLYGAMVLAKQNHPSTHPA